MYAKIVVMQNGVTMSYIGTFMTYSISNNHLPVSGLTSFMLGLIFGTLSSIAAIRVKFFAAALCRQVNSVSGCCQFTLIR